MLFRSESKILTFVPQAGISCAYNPHINAYVPHYQPPLGKSVTPIRVWLPYLVQVQICENGPEIHELKHGFDPMTKKNVFSKNYSDFPDSFQPSCMAWCLIDSGKQISRSQLKGHEVHR